jgi:hypothetical protein
MAETEEEAKARAEAFAIRVSAARKLGEVLRLGGAISPDPKRKVISVGAGSDALYIYMQNGTAETKQAITEIADREVPGHPLKFVASGPIRPL